ncbi:MAG: hypothetical protein HUK17_05010 [Bacteroidales bacterium]|nr:hypothetical protein [Bacteroidales bacterium]
MKRIIILFLLALPALTSWGQTFGASGATSYSGWSILGGGNLMSNITYRCDNDDAVVDASASSLVPQIGVQHFRFRHRYGFTVGTSFQAFCYFQDFAADVTTPDAFAHVEKSVRYVSIGTSFYGGWLFYNDLALMANIGIDVKGLGFVLGDISAGLSARFKLTEHIVGTASVSRTVYTTDMGINEYTFAHNPNTDAIFSSARSTTLLLGIGYSF